MDEISSSSSFDSSSFAVDDNCRGGVKAEERPLFLLAAVLAATSGRGMDERVVAKALQR